MPRFRYPRRAYVRRRILRRRPRRALALAKRVNLSGAGVHYFRRRYVVANITSTTSGAGVQSNAAGAMSFSLSGLPNASEFTALFDQYKIMKVKLDFIPFGDNVNLPISTMSGANALVSPGGPLITAIDYDDSNVPTAASDLLQYQASRVVPVPKRLKMTLRPKFAIEVYRSTVATGYGARSGWLDCANPDIPHYGVKYYMNAPSALNSSMTYQVWATVFIGCKGVI